MNTLSNKLFWLISSVLLHISFHVGAMDLTQVPSSIDKAGHAELTNPIVDLEKQLADEKQRLFSLQIKMGQELIAKRKEIQGLQTTYKACKASWCIKEQDYKSTIHNFEVALKQKYQEKEKVQELLSNVCNHIYPRLKKQNDMQQCHLEVLKDYKEAVKEYKEKKENLRLEDVVQEVEYKKNMYKDLLLLSLASFLLYFSWVQYSHIA